MAKIKCTCRCHTTSGVKHIKACCDNGWVNVPASDIIDSVIDPSKISGTGKTCGYCDKLIDNHSEFGGYVDKVGFVHTSCYLKNIRK